MDALNFDSKDEVIAAAIRFVEEKAVYTSETLQSARETKDLLRLRIGDKEREIFCVLYLNSQHQLIEVEELFQGTIDCAAVIVSIWCIDPTRKYRYHGQRSNPST